MSCFKKFGKERIPMNVMGKSLISVLLTILHQPKFKRYQEKSLLLENLLHKTLTLVWTIKSFGINISLDIILYHIFS